MNSESFFYYSLYELGLWANDKWPWLLFIPGYKNLMDTLLPYWEAWKIKLAADEAEQQATTISEQEGNDEQQAKAEALAEKAEELFPEAIVTPLPDVIVPSVMIEKPPPADASEDIKALGFGELRITHQLPELDEN